MTKVVVGMATPRLLEEPANGPAREAEELRPGRHQRADGQVLRYHLGRHAFDPPIEIGGSLRACVEGPDDEGPCALRDVQSG